MAVDEPELELRELGGVVDLMEAALRQPSGLRVVVDSPRAALKLRRQIYSVRRRARWQADFSFDGLSIVVCGCEVSIIVRLRSRGPAIEGAIHIQPLHTVEVPTAIGSRGPAKMGLIDAVQILDLLGNVSLRG